MKTKSHFPQNKKVETFHFDLMFEFIIVAYTTQADYIILRLCLFFLPHYSVFQGLLFFPQLNMTAGFLCGKPVY